MYFIVAIIVLAVVLALFAGVVLYFFNMAFLRKFKTDVNGMDTTIDKALKPFSTVISEGMKFLEETPYETCFTTAFDGIKLAGRYYNNNSSNTIFLFHGYRSNGSHDFSCAVEMYYNMGFNVMMVDQRAHGKSEGKYITFGVNESRDVVSWVEYVNRKFEPKQVIISGISMGATTVLLSLNHNLPKNVKGVIADCGFTSPAEIIEKVGKDTYKVNAHFFIPFLDLACRFLGNFSIRNVSTIESVKKSNLPILYIHGQKDNFVPCYMTEMAYKSRPENSRIFLSSEAGHGMSFLFDTESVTKELKSFLNFCITDE